MLVAFLYNCSRILLKYAGSIGIWNDSLPNNQDVTAPILFVRRQKRVADEGTPTLNDSDATMSSGSATQGGQWLNGLVRSINSEVGTVRSRPGRSYNSHAGLIFPAHPAEGSRRGSGNRALSNRLQDCRGVSDQQERTHPMNMASNVTRVRASRVWLSAVAIALLLVVSNTAPATAQSTATVMVSNLEEAEYARIWLNPGQAYAHSFHTGNTAVTLEKVRLHLRGAESTPAVTIRADNSGQPYRSLQALTNPSIDSLISTHEDFTTTGYVLAANTTYWVVFHRQWGQQALQL